MDGESWETDDYVDNSIQANKSDDFEGWENWKAKNKQGLDCSVLIRMKDNKIIVTTENSGISIRNDMVINDTVDDIYVSLTGDQCAITNIKIKQT
jgi:uncharacterized protein YpmB